MKRKIIFTIISFVVIVLWMIVAASLNSLVLKESARLSDYYIGFISGLLFSAIYELHKKND